MTFALMPAWREPTVSTPKSPGAISRATRVCSRVTTAAVSTTGSTLRCGIEPCEPVLDRGAGAGGAERGAEVIGQHGGSHESLLCRARRGPSSGGAMGRMIGCVCPRP